MKTVKTDRCMVGGVMLVLMTASCGRPHEAAPQHTDPVPTSIGLSSTDRVVVSVGGAPAISFSIENMKPRSQKRGISLTAFNGDVEFTLASFDPCNGTTDLSLGDYSFQQDIERHRNHFDTFIVTVSDSATCGNTDLSPLFEGTGLQDWRSIGFRTPYIATITNGVTAEYHGTRETSVAALVTSRGKSPAGIQRPSGALPMIAHGGGGFQGMSYTNSIDALEFNKDKYELFEIDFSWTSDQKLVCLHDWEHSYKRSFGLEPEGAKTLAEFEELVATRSPVRKCTLDNLVTWLRANPDERIITDIKDENIRALSELKRLYPDMLHRFVPQVYQPEEYYVARELGYDDVIWTLYIYPGETSEVLKHLSYMDLYGLTISRTRARTGLAKQAFDKTGVRSWTHTVNSLTEAAEMQGHGVSSIYTDFLVPPLDSAPDSVPASI